MTDADLIKAKSLIEEEMIRRDSNRETQKPRDKK